ncbi:TolC family protein [Mesorhizobium sp. SB112]|uniref:TolC family protein n=1 Tax=Mesorhizobium sp. SB112 TaxID=3151853 RepID=UPI0032659B95
MRSKLFLGGLSLIATVPPVSSQELSLEDAVRKAVSWHPSIDEAIGRLNQQAERINEAKSGYMPRVEGGLSTSYGNRDEGFQPVLNLSASQMIYDFGKVSSAVDSATAGTQGTRARVLLAVDQLVRETSYSAIELQRNRALRAVAREQISGITAITDLVRERTEKGASTRSDQVQAEARLEEAVSAELQISSQLDRWAGSLANLTGQSGAINMSSKAPKWLLKACDSAKPEWEELPEVQEADASRRVALAELDRSRAEALPTLSLEARTGLYLNGDSSRDHDMRLGFNLSSSIYQGGAASARRNAAGHALRAADAAKNNARIEVQRRLSEASLQTSGLTRLLSSLSNRGKMMKETRDLYREQYIQLGTRTLLDLLNAEQELHQANFEAVNTVHDLRRLRIDCVFNTGKSRTLFGLEGMSVRGVSLRK